MAFVTMQNAEVVTEFFFFLRLKFPFSLLSPVPEGSVGLFSKAGEHSRCPSRLPGTQRHSADLGGKT